MKNTNRVFRFIQTILISAAIIACTGPDERKAEYLDRGKQFLDEGNYAKARIEIKNVLQIDPKTAEAYLLMGQIEEKEGDVRRAFANYLRVTELDPTNITAQVKVARVYILGGRTDQGQEMVDKILTADPNNVEARTLHAAVLARGGDREGALAQVDEVLSENAALTDAALLGASLRVSAGSTEDAIRVLERAIGSSEKNIAPRLALVDIYIREQRFDQAEAALMEMAKLEPTELSHRVRLAKFYQSRGDKTKAETVLREMAQSEHESDQPALTLVEFVAASRGAEAAEQELKTFVTARPQSFPLRFALAKTLRANGKRDDARAIYRAVETEQARGPNRGRARTELATMALEENKLDEAGTILATALEESPGDVEVLAVRGRLAFVKQAYEDATADFRAVLKQKPEAHDIALLLSRTLEMSGQRELALDQLRGLVESAPQKPALRLELARMLSQAGSLNAALEQVDEVLKKAPNNIPALDARVDLLAQQQKWTLAEETAIRIKTAAPESHLGAYRLALLYAAQNKLKPSIVELETVEKQLAGKNEQVVRALARNYVANKEGAKAQSYLRKVSAAGPDRVFAQELLADLLVSQQQVEEARQIYEQLKIAAPKDATVYQKLANLAIMAGKENEAEQTLQRGINATGGSVALSLALAELYQRQGKVDAAVTQYQKMYDKNPSSASAANNLAMVLATLKDDQSSLDKATILIKKLEQSQNPAHLDTVGWVHYRRGNYEAATPMLEKAVSAAPDSPLLRYHAGMAQFKLGNRIAAREHLLKATSTESEFFGKREAVAVLESLVSEAAP